MTRPTRLAALALLGVLTALAGCTQVAEGPGARNAARVAPGAAADSAQVVALLGGARNVSCPLPGVATAGQPAASQVKALAQAGFRSVVDLRLPDEPRGFDEPAVVRAAGLEYRALPIGHQAVPDSTFGAFRALMADTASRPVLVHCASGNRIGPVMMAWLVLDLGWDEERALAAAKQGGLRSPALEASARDYIRRQRR